MREDRRRSEQPCFRSVRHGENTLGYSRKDKPMNQFLARGLVVALLSVSAGCRGSGPQAEKLRLNAGGSTFVYPLMSKWAAVYEKEKGVQINYQSIGSGGGIQKMTAKEFDF